jgi:hypothetical protein
VATATAVPPAAFVKIDIVEKVDGKPSKENLAAYFIRKKLREAGFEAWSARPIHADEAARKKSGAAPERPETPGTPPPEADFVIAGSVEVRLGNVSTFYGKVVAVVYESEANLKIFGKDQKVFAAIEDKDSWGQKTEEEARAQALKRIALFLSADVLKSDAIRARVPEKSKSAVETYIAGIEKKRRRPAEREGEEEEK